MARRPAALVLVTALMTSAAAAQETITERPAVSWRHAFKTTGLFSHAFDDPEAEARRAAATAFWRLRTETVFYRGRLLSFELAVDQRVRATTSPASSAAALVLPAAVAPYRVRQLDWPLAAGTRGTWHLEIDRAALRVQTARTTLTMGRQAVGWGRGVLFTAIDLFAPFTPLEVDREWRRGVDAVRADVKVTDRASFDALAAFGSALDRSTFAARVRGYATRADLELVAGRRTGDAFAGFAVSAPIGDAEMHAEMALMRAGGHSLVAAVAGGSHQFAIGNGLLAAIEYHRSAATSAAGSAARHYSAVTSSYEWSPELTLSALWLASYSDRSGTIVPSATITFNDRWSLLVSGYLPYGRTPFGLLAQLRVYR